VKHSELVQNRLVRRKNSFASWRDVSHYKIGMYEPSLAQTDSGRLPQDDNREVVDLLQPFDVPIYWRAEDANIEETGWANEGLPALRTLTELGGLVIAPPDNLDDLVVASLKTMLPHIKADLSIVNSIIELKDLKTVKRSLAEVIKLARGFLPNGQFTLRQLLKTGADGYLQTKFNFIPLWSDIVGIHRAVSSSLRRLGVQVNAGTSPLIAHYRRRLKEFDDPEEEESVVFESTTEALEKRIPATAYYTMAQTSYRSVKYSETQFHAQVQYNANYTAFQIEHARGLVLLDKLGVNLNPAIVWNAIPWSFVVDWLFNVGEYLSRFTIQNMEPVINIMQFLWSVKRERVITVRTIFESFGSGSSLFANSGTKSYTYPAIVETSYRRQTGLPDASSFLTSGLNLNEFSLAAALAISRRRQRTRRGSRKGA
jgi:hypothetical protein